MIDREHLARSINNTLQGAGFDPVDMAMVAQFQLADAKIRQGAGEKIVGALGLGVPDTNSSAGPNVSGGYLGLRRELEPEEKSHVRDAQAE